MVKDKIIFITGGASGLGRVLVDQAVSDGAKVFFTYKKSKDNALLLMKKYGECVDSICSDASDFTSTENAVNACMEKFGRIDVLVNNASNSKDNSLDKITYEDFDFTLKNVLYPAFNCTKCIAPILKKNGVGKIITVGSINGIRGREGSLAYSTAKSGLIGFTKTIAKELGCYNINCNLVAPGFINTDGQKNTSPLVKKMVLDECVIRKLTEPEEICNLILFLASDLSNNITGQVYRIDCGQGM